VANIGTVPLAFTWLITPGLRHCPNTIGTAHGRLRPHQRSVANIGTVPLAGDYARPAELPYRSRETYRGLPRTSNRSEPGQGDRGLKIYRSAGV